MSTRCWILTAVILGYLLFGAYPIMAQQYKDVLLESIQNPLTKATNMIA